MSREPHSERGAFALDDRGVSPVVGALLLFAIGVMLVATLQVTAVPALNEQVEFRHSERVQSDLVGISAAVDRTAATGLGQTVRVEAGMRYPTRPLFVNPAPVSGSLRTADRGVVTVSGASATGETGDVWNGSVREFPTTALVYRAGYHEYGSAPVTRIEPWGTVNRFGERTLPVTEPSLVDGRRVTLVAFDGNRSTSRVDVLPVSVRPTSAPARTVTVSAGDDPVTISVPTQIPEDVWAEALAAEYDPNDTASDRYVADYDCANDPPAPCGELTLELEANTMYEFRLGEVAVGSGASDEAATYLTDVVGNGSTVYQGSRQRLVVEARDRFDNPVSNVTVSGSVANADGDDTSTGTLGAVSPVTGADGRASFVYEAPNRVEGTTNLTVTLRFGSGEAEARRVTFDVQATGPLPPAEAPPDEGPPDGGEGGTGGETGNGTGGGGEAGNGTGGGETGSESPDPSVSISDLSRTNQGGGNVDQYDVSVDVSDPNGDLREVTFTLEALDGTVLDSATAPISGESTSQTGRLRVEGRNNVRDEYRIVVTVVDEAGNAVSVQRTVSGGDRGNNGGGGNRGNN